MSHHIARCRGAECRAPIIFMRTDTGKQQPVDASPLEHAEAYQLLADSARWPGLFVLAEGDPIIRSMFGGMVLADGDEVYRAHWATCPNRDDFRR